MKKIGLALGGGGAKGLAHILMLEVFDELGICPHRISGTSIGAVIGALYASGTSGKQIREKVRSMIVSKEEFFRDALKRKDVFRWIKFLDVELGRGGLFKGEKFMEYLYAAIGVSTFEELKIPLKIVAADFWKSGQVIFDSGELLPAVKASMGLPGIFTPAVINDRILIDGGSVNPLPYDILGDCDITVAVDVMGHMRSQGKHKMPNLFRVISGTFDIMQNSIIAEKLKKNPPDIYIKPGITGVDILEFYKAEEIYLQSAPAAYELRERLQLLLESGHEKLFSLSGLYRSIFRGSGE